MKYFLSGVIAGLIAFISYGAGRKIIFREQVLRVTVCVGEVNNLLDIAEEDEDVKRGVNAYFYSIAAQNPNLSGVELVEEQVYQLVKKCLEQGSK